MEQLGVLEISLKFVCVLDRIGIIFKGLVFKESGKIGVPQEKPLGAHLVLTPGFEPKVGGLSPLCHPCSQKNCVKSFQSYFGKQDSHNII